MSRGKKQQAPIISLIILAIVFVAVLTTRITTDNESSQSVLSTGDGSITVHFLDVGQGDSEFIELPNGECMLIDASISEYGDDIAEYITACGYSKIDYLVATHPHADHIGGMRTVVNSLDIGEVYMPKAVSNSKTFEKLLTAISDKGLQINTAKAGKTIYSDDQLEITILSPIRDEYDDLNNYSVVIKITYGQSDFLFVGDAEELSENDLLEDSYNDLSSDVLKVGHHGSSSSSSVAFLDAVMPKYSVISCGIDNSYGHPHEESMLRLAKTGTQIYRTDLEGTVIITSDGNDNFEVKTEK